MLNVEAWAEIRRLHRVDGMAIRGISRRLGVARETVARALRAKGPPVYRRRAAPAKLDPFKGRIADLLAEYPRLSAVRVREILRAEGYTGGMTILRDYLHQGRPRPIQAFPRTRYQPGGIGQRGRGTVGNGGIHAGLEERPLDRFDLERTQLLTLPDEPYQAEEILFAKASCWGYVRLDANDYSVPLLLAGRRMGARLDATSVRIYQQGQLVAPHPRRFGHHQGMTIPEHQ